jgi:hypothetical protein
MLQDPVFPVYLYHLCGPGVNRPGRLFIPSAGDTSV